MIVETSREVGEGILQILAWLWVLILLLEKMDNPYDDDDFK